MTSLTAQGFENWETGGGCSAWVKKLPTGQFMVLTSDTPLYHHLHHDALIGIYDGAKDGDELWGNLIGSCALEFNEEEEEEEHTSYRVYNHNETFLGEFATCDLAEAEAQEYRKQTGNAAYVEMW